MRFMAWLHAPMSSGGNSTPAFPTTSGSELAFEANTAVPHAIASRTGSPNPS
jgi:hypothetical protein